MPFRREQEHRRQSLQLVPWCVIAFAVVVLALLALLLAKYREVQHKNRALYDRMTQLLEANSARRRCALAKALGSFIARRANYWSASLVLITLYSITQSS